MQKRLPELISWTGWVRLDWNILNGVAFELFVEEETIFRRSPLSFEKRQRLPLLYYYINKYRGKRRSMFFEIKKSGCCIAVLWYVTSDDFFTFSSASQFKKTSTETLKPEQMLVIQLSLVPNYYMFHWYLLYHLFYFPFPIVIIDVILPGSESNSHLWYRLDIFKLGLWFESSLEPFGRRHVSTCICDIGHII